jgi:AcrR family transcriptional regulator
MKADDMSTPLVTLSQRHSDLTEGLILAAAIDLLEHSSVGELTVGGVAQRANISSRTIFRYFPTRDEFLSAIAAEAIRSMDLPPHPASLEELLDMPRALYRAFESRTSLVKAALHSELFDRIRSAPAQQRWVAVGKLLDRHAPKATPRERKLATANIRFFLSATTWHYYRFYFGFNLPDTIAAAETAIRQALAGVGVKIPTAK